MSTPLRLAAETEDYDRLGISPGTVSLHEGRTHVDGTTGQVEWWFLRSDTPAGAVTIGITSSPFFMGELGLQPTANLLIDLPDGTSVVKNAVLTADAFRSLPDDAGIEAGDNYYRREPDGSYHAHFDDGDITADIVLTPSDPPGGPRPVTSSSASMRRATSAGPSPCPQAKPEYP